MEKNPQFSHQPGAKPEPRSRERNCELPGCDEPLSMIPGREYQNRYCGPEHRAAAHQLRRAGRKRRDNA